MAFLSYFPQAPLLRANRERGPPLLWGNERMNFNMIFRGFSVTKPCKTSIKYLKNGRNNKYIPIGAFTDLNCSLSLVLRSIPTGTLMDTVFLSF